MDPAAVMALPASEYLLYRIQAERIAAAISPS